MKRIKSQPRDIFDQCYLRIGEWISFGVLSLNPGECGSMDYGMNYGVVAQVHTTGACTGSFDQRFVSVQSRFRTSLAVLHFGL